tara:strand:+ start:75 stop:1259 length:1185 start_codon:yes stop_codon:yes gene_type:complete
MIIKSLEKLPERFIYIDSKSSKYNEDFKYIAKILCNIKISQNISNKNDIHLTLDPEFYFSNIKNNSNIRLYVFSIDIDNSNFINLFKYLKTNNLNNIVYKKEFFLKYLYENFPKRKFNIKLLNFFAKFGISIIKFNLNKNFWLPKVIFKENLYKGYKIGLSDYNYYKSKSKNFKESFKFIYNSLSDEKSKEIYFDILYSKPSVIWKNYFNKLLQDEHYQDYLNFKNANLINLGVDKGFEIPLFLSSNLNKLINVDPSGNKHLESYTLKFINFFKNIVEFEESSLYNSNFFKNKNVKVTNLSSLIIKYNCQKNLIIKSDIEGSEVNLVEELPEIIEKYRPQLAISIYHVDKSKFPEIIQLVSLPKKIINMCKNYNFFLKHYSHNRRETVFYAIPR